MKKTIGICFLLVVFGTDLFSQCDVSTHIGKHSTVYVAKEETIFMNKDLENGVLKYQMSIIMMKDTNTAIPDYFMIDCKLFTSSYYGDNGIVPRRIAFYFGELKAVGLIALRQTQIENLPVGFSGQNYSYEITSELLSLLKTNSLIGIQILDTRTGKSLDFYPYKDMLKEQVNCILAISSTTNHN